MRCLQSVAPQSQTLAPQRYEVIVTDDGRSGATRDMLVQDYPFAKWVEGPSRGPASNRNCGAAQASGQWLAFIDDDCLASSGWLKAIAEIASTGQYDVVEGKTLTPDKCDDPFIESVENSQGGVFWSCNLSVRKSTFDALGGFDQDFLGPGGEDMEFAWRLKARGIPTIFCPEALVLHPARRISFKQLWWRTFFIRWILLYEHKIGAAVPVSDNAVKALCSVTTRMLLRAIRESWHAIRLKDKSRWRTMMFYASWRWLTLPMVLPYLWFCELEFRKLLSAEKSGVLP